ncbi:MAG: glycosyl transferase [Ignavibacteria bacterium RIFCSPLOWO2_02_FULL_55_14]|nr:MAG: glycosyl transferase [Ignavibacteria bacterium GWC2_56_12]OGU71722.1 MAG: glycosyl transferase [Ignavibacteria bacterium RIFCSPLOWO2_02_FULL_55_14]OGU72831.1 MAG: glycosyl transferase [Ignavibacteria bacterium RIFCSPLOWO2_12_FULL_56_21]HAV22394.1 glycosyl transferase [Bacteroidota bacterium]
MSRITVALPHSLLPSFSSTLRQFIESPLVVKVFVLHAGDYQSGDPKCEGIQTDALTSGKTLNGLFKYLRTEFLLFVSQSHELQLGQAALERFVDVAQQTGAGLTYADYHEIKAGQRSEHPLIDYQLGSIRDGFDFGAMMLFTGRAVRNALATYGKVANVERAGLCDLRLKVSADHPVVHIQEYLYTKVESDLRKTGEKLFDYVDPRNRAVQVEMEKVATEHLKNIGAYLRPKFSRLPKDTEEYPVEASVVIPVRNREKTVADAVNSVLRQRTQFPFNIIVVDNHSTDRTGDILRELARGNSKVVHQIPLRHDLGIGGCWNEAVLSAQCGKYAVQLDSDDLYSDETTLQRVVDTFRSGNFAMVIGSYRLVDMNLQELPPGLIDHREWTPTNGRNNALRINGLGAPRAFRTFLLRRMLLPNVSYGEDYAAAIRLSREYQIGRIYESLYLCRRWEGNTDAALSIERANRNDIYKDRIRTVEIMARQQLNSRKGRKPAKNRSFR